MFTVTKLSSELVISLKAFLDKQDSVFDFTDKHFSSLLVCYMLISEIGGINDDLSRFIYNMDTMQKVDKTKIKVELGVLSDVDGFALRLTYPDATKILPSSPDLRKLLISHQNEIIISPIYISDYISSHAVKSVLVKDWINRIYFSNFDIINTTLKEQTWMLRDNDTYLYSKLVSQSKLIFHGTHDLAGHIVGLDAKGLQFAANVATNIADKFEQYFGASGRGNMPSHILSFMVGLLLDDLTQSSCYFSAHRAEAIEVLLQSLAISGIDPRRLSVLAKFPILFNQTLQSIRNVTIFSLEKTKEYIADLIAEIIRNTEVVRMVA